MSRNRDILDMDPWKDDTEKKLKCYACGKEIGKDAFIWMNEREKNGKHTGKVVYFHKSRKRNCYKPGAEIKKLEKHTKDTGGKLITEDFDQW